MKSPAETSSAIDSAICAVASDVRKRAAARAPDGWPAWPLSVDTEIGPRAVQRREEAEEQPGAERQRAGEEHRRPVDLSATTRQRRPAAGR